MPILRNCANVILTETEVVAGVEPFVTIQAQNGTIIPLSQTIATPVSKRSAALPGIGTASLDHHGRNRIGRVVDSAGRSLFAVASSKREEREDLPGDVGCQERRDLARPVVRR